MMPSDGVRQVLVQYKEKVGNNHRKSQSIQGESLEEDNIKFLLKVNT